MDTTENTAITLSPLVGHTAQQADILKMLGAERMPHALLLRGPKGIGKRQFADWLAWRLLCGPEKGGMFGEGEGFTYDSTSADAAQLAQGAHPGLHVLEPEAKSSIIKIGQWRSIHPRLHLSADGWRVVIVDAADDLNENTANALLKTLEEPLPNTVLLLISHQPSRLLPTIISRCRQVTLKPLDGEQMAQVLSGHKTKLDAQVLMPLAAGSPGYALDIDQAASTVLPNIAAGCVDSSQLAAEVAESILKNANGQTAFSLLQWWVAMCARHAMGLPAPDLPGDLKQQLAATGKQADAFTWARLYSTLQEMRFDQADMNLNPQLGLENAINRVTSTLEQAASSGNS